MSEDDESEKKLADEADQKRIREIVLDHLGIPRPRQLKHIEILQDQLLPLFLDLARHASLVSSAYPLRSLRQDKVASHPTYKTLLATIEETSHEVAELSRILEELGVHEVLAAVARESNVSAVRNLPIDDFDIRLLKQSGNSEPLAMMRSLLGYAAEHSRLMEDSDGQLLKGKEALLRALEQFQSAMESESHELSPSAASIDSRNQKRSGAIPQKPTEPKPKRLKLVAGITEIASGLVLLSGNGVVVPTITFGSLAALPVFGSFAAGIAAVGKGVSSFLREGE